MNTKVISAETDYNRALQEASVLLKKGQLVAFPTETVYGLGADAFNEEAVRNIFVAKGRPQDNPLIVHIADFNQLSKLASDVSETAEKLINAFWPGPFTMIFDKKAEVPDSVTAGLDTVAVRMPINGFAHDLIYKSNVLIAAPSANLSGKPSPTTAKHVYDDMQGRIPLIVDGGSCNVGVESTVCCIKDGVPVILRPGGITAEMIRSVAGTVKIHDAVLGELKDEKPASPGMKYKHYAPKASVEVVCGPPDDVAKTIKLRYDNNKLDSVVFCMQQHVQLYPGMKIQVLGKTYAEAAKVLFQYLRNADENGINHIYFHGLGTDEEGLAVMNRIIRSAGHNVTAAAKED